ncbi:hypothetical protein CDAR_435191 [Caerostris darwini]|uniref:Uncharacterized protein n=1 Tax=Caerostris darwini TaxID=1538125 RepID=A0AAV4SGK6_9ARAC|nr:hypothetical protein CDAR_435191 [Caerostris darwini]
MKEVSASTPEENVFLRDFRIIRLHDFLGPFELLKQERKLTSLDVIYISHHSFVSEKSWKDNYLKQEL